MKVCLKCGKEKALDLFTKGKNSCKECSSNYIKEYYLKNKEYILNKEKSKYNNNKSEILERLRLRDLTDEEKVIKSEYLKKYRQDNKEKLSKKRKEYNKANSQKIKENRRKRYKERYRNDIDFKLKKIYRNLLKRTILYKTDSTYEILGYTYLELKSNIESKFKENMSWENYGEWEIDHIIPISHFDLKTVEPKVVHSLDNLQPLWREENIKKGNKIWKSEVDSKSLEEPI